LVYTGHSVADICCRGALATDAVMPRLQEQNDQQWCATIRDGSSTWVLVK